MGLKAVIDTNVVIYHLQGRLREPLSGAELHLSVISEIELLSHPNLTPEAEELLRTFLSTLTIVPLAQSIKESAIQLRRRHRLRTPDAIICATANVLGLPLMTNDVRLSQIPSDELRLAQVDFKE